MVDWLCSAYCLLFDLEALEKAQNMALVLGLVRRASLMAGCSGRYKSVLATLADQRVAFIQGMFVDLSFVEPKNRFAVAGSGSRFVNSPGMQWGVQYQLSPAEKD